MWQLSTAERRSNELVLGGTLASIPGIAWARPKPYGTKCNYNHQCASGQCVDRVCGGGGCVGCPVFQCICVEDLRNPGVQVCVSDIGDLIESGDCNRDCGEAVCIDAGGGAVECHGPCVA